MPQKMRIPQIGAIPDGEVIFVKKQSFINNQGLQTAAVDGITGKNPIILWDIVMHMKLLHWIVKTTQKQYRWHRHTQCR
jgi:hypothetical protein